MLLQGEFFMFLFLHESNLYYLDFFFYIFIIKLINSRFMLSVNKFTIFCCSIRILPHQQNTGAFFVAVLEKVKPLTSKEKSSSAADVSKNSPVELGKRPFDEKLPENQRKRRKKTVYREDPFVFFTKDEPVWTDIKSFYKISDDFEYTCLLTRCEAGKKKNIYLTSPGIRDLVAQNQTSIKFINTGVKTFVRSDNRNMKCAFRIAQDGLESVFPFVGAERKIHVPKEDLVTMLLNDAPDKAPQIVTLSEGVQEQVKDLCRY